MTKQDRKSQIILTLFFIVLCATVLFPFWLVISVSLSNEADIINAGYKVLPMKFDLSAYGYIFKNPTSILNAYKTTIIFSFVSMVLSVMLMAMIAYPMSRRTLKGKKTIAFFLYFTVLFNGGLVPTYILITQYLHMGDTIWVYIIPGLINPWYVFMMRTFIQSIPDEICESALIDGADQYTIFIKIILPLSMPVLATIALFVFLLKWNDWYNSMLYINNDTLFSLQYLLQRIMQNIALLQENSKDLASIVSLQDIPSETVRMAMAVVVAGPALLVFPFFQKYFVKGITVGSVKG